MHPSLPSSKCRIVLVLLLACGFAVPALSAASERGPSRGERLARILERKEALRAARAETPARPAAGPRTTGWSLAQEGMPTLNGAAFGASTYVLVGNYGEIWTSPDGAGWTKRSNPANQVAYGVTFGGGQFVAVGGLGMVLTSPDGVTWTVQASPTTSLLYAVTFGGGQYVAVGSTGRVITSPDGVTWTQQASNTTRTLRGVTHGGGQFVAVGSSREVITSPDGITWTVRTPGVPATVSTLYGVAHGAGVFVVAASGGLIASPDAITWTHTFSGATHPAVTHTGTVFVAVAFSSVRTSPDGTAWTASSLNPAPGVPQFFQAVTFGSAGAVAAGFYGSIFASPDGTTPWTSRTFETSRALYGVASDGNAFCAVGRGSFPAVDGPVSRSADGITWTTGAAVVSAVSIAYGNGLYVAVGSSLGGGGIMTSPDCVTWTDHSFMPPGSDGADFDGVAFGGGRFVAVGQKYPPSGPPFDIPLIATSPDGITWTEVDPQLPTNDDGTLWAIGHGNGLWVAAGFNYNTGEFYLTTSPDGLTWTRQTPTGIPIGNFDYPEEIAYGNGIFVMVGTQIFSSPDAINWTPRVNDYTLDVTYAANQFVATSPVNSGTGNSGVYVSPDGITWALEVYPSAHNGNGVGYSPALDRFVVVGDSVVLYAGGGLPQVSIGDVSVGEGNAGSTNASFSVTLSASSTQTVTVGYATADGTATAGSDYTAVSGTLSFAPGTTLQTIDVPVLGDTAIELDETFLVNLGAAVNATVADGQGQGTIANDDLPTVSIGDVSVVEGSSGTTNASFSVTLSASSPATVTVGYATADGTATAGSDYTAVSGTLSFAPGTTLQTIGVPVLGDTAVELDETFLVNLSAAVNATVADGQGQGTITNDDVPAVSVGDAYVIEGSSGFTDASFSVSLSAASTLAITVAYATADGTATAGSDYTATSGTLTFAPGQTAAIVMVPVVGDTVVEVDEAFLVNLSSPTNATLGDAQGTGYISDDDAVSLSQDELIHGSQETYDLAAQPGPVADVDYYRIAQRPRSSYEVLIDATSADVVPVIAERLAADNVTVLQTGAPVAGGASVSLRFRNDLASTITNQTISVRSGGCTTTCNASAVYRLRSYDTTSTVARFNNSGTQVTVVVLQNTADDLVAGTLWFWNTAGGLAGSWPFSIAAHGTLTLNAATVVPSTGGTITVSNDGRHGDLSGKAVAVEPATGFTFDTPLVLRGK